MLPVIDGELLVKMSIVFSRTASTYTHAAGVAEQTALTYSPIANNIVKGIWLDLTNLTQSATIRVKYQIDGTNYRTFETTAWTTADDDGVLIGQDSPIAANKSLRVTLQSGTTEGTTRNIATEIWSEGLGAGAVEWVYTLLSSVDSTPIQGAEIWGTTDSSGSNVICSGLTDSSGQVTFYLQTGTIFIWRRHPDFDFSANQPDEEVVS